MLTLPEKVKCVELAKKHNNTIAADEFGISNTAVRKLLKTESQWRKRWDEAQRNDRVKNMVRRGSLVHKEEAKLRYRQLQQLQNTVFEDGEEAKDCEGFRTPRETCQRTKQDADGLLQRMARGGM